MGQQAKKHSTSNWLASDENLRLLLLMVEGKHNLVNAEIT